jgi:hypothetical protein
MPLAAAQRSKVALPLLRLPFARFQNLLDEHLHHKALQP